MKQRVVQEVGARKFGFKYDIGTVLTTDGTTYRFRNGLRSCEVNRGEFNNLLATDSRAAVESLQVANIYYK